MVVSEWGSERGVRTEEGGLVLDHKETTGTYCTVWKAKILASHIIWNKRIRRRHKEGHQYGMIGSQSTCVPFLSCLSLVVPIRLRSRLRTFVLLYYYTINFVVVPSQGFIVVLVDSNSKYYCYRFCVTLLLSSVLIINYVFSYGKKTL